MSGGESHPFLLLENERVVRRYIDDNERKEKVYLVLDEAKDEHKMMTEESESISKELDDLLQKRDSNLDEFELLAERSTALLVAMQEVNLVAVLESQKLITEEEWDSMRNDFYQKNIDLVKSAEKMEKRLIKMLDRNRRKIDRAIDDEKKAATLYGAIDAFYSELSQVYLNHQQLMLDKEALIYQHQLSKKQVEEMQRNHAEDQKLVFDAIVKLYFEVVENTDDKEWRKMNKRFKIPFLKTI